MRVLVTGGAGFIGSQIVRTLEANGHEVTVLDALTYAGKRSHLHGTKARFLQGNICNPRDVAAAMAAQDAVVHAAAESHVGRSLSEPGLFVRVNMDGTRIMLDAACRMGVPRFVLVSTDEVFGSAPEGVWFAPDAPHRPGNAYAASKSGAEGMVHAWRHTHSYPATIVRCTNNYGPRQHLEKAIPWWIRDASTKTTVAIHGQGTAIRDWLYVEDCARGICAAVEQWHPAACWHLAGQNLQQNRTVATAVIDACGGNAALVFGPDRPGQDARYALNDAHTRAALDWAPQVTMAEGLARTVAWYRERPELWR